MWEAIIILVWDGAEPDRKEELMKIGTRIKAIRGPYAKRFLFGTVTKFECFDLSGPDLIAEVVTEYTIAFENGEGNVLGGLPSVAVLSGRDLVSL